MQVGDGTTSVIILGGELLALSSDLLEQMHATLVIAAFRKALDDLLESLQKLSFALPILVLLVQYSPSERLTLRSVS